jgi:hypothetical protein
MRTGGGCVLLPFSPLAILVLLFCVAPGILSAQVVLNEVLYDPDGPDNGFEFVELMNCGHAAISLAGFVLETGNGAAPDDWTVEWIGGDLDFLDPGEILLIGEEAVVPPPDYVTALDLQNGPDAVRLTNGADVVDVVGWGEPLFDGYYEGEPAPDASSGNSLARSPDCYDEDVNALDFVVCPAPTPGTRNVLESDLTIAVRHARRVVFDADGPVTVRCLVRNAGSLVTSGEPPVVELLVDGAPSPVAARTLDEPLAPRDSVEIALEWARPPEGYHEGVVLLEFGPDAAPANNRAETTFTVGRPGGLLAVNEILYSPTDGATEWVELVNTTADTVGVAGWALGDDVDAFALVGGEAPHVAGRTDDALAVPPGGYLVVAKDADLLGSAGPALVVETDGWEALSADDVVVLLDAYETPIDRVQYVHGWGGGRGVSLERVRADMPAADVNNWGSSVATGGSTPGRENSIHVASLPSAGTLDVAPNPFTPDGDGANDRTVIGFDLPLARATARLTVFDALGRPRAVLLDHAAVPERHELIWDGSGADGALLPSGLYVLYLEAMGARQGVLVTAKKAVGIVR